MKLKQIKKIKGYKSFQDFTWQSFFNNEHFHDDINIFYGENGSGKSAICNILKNVLNGDDLLNKNFGYKSFGKYKPKEICLEFDCGECSYLRKDWDEADSANQENIERGLVGNWWNKKLSTSNAILFFDREFVAKNVHEYERKTTKDGQEQQSGKLIIEFDSEAINLRNVRDKTRKTKDEQDQKVKNFKEANKDSLAFFLNEEEKSFFQKYKEQAEEKIKSAKQELAKEKKEAEKNLETEQGLQKKVASIQSDIKELPKVEVEIFLSSYETYQAIFNFDLKEQTKIEAEQTLIDKIKAHKSFFDTGFEIRKTHQNQCPFCQSKNEEVEIKKIVDSYNQIYDATYKAQVQQFEKDKQRLIEELLLISQILADFDLNLIFLVACTPKFGHNIPHKAVMV